jgi:hypothetical protein
MIIAIAGRKQSGKTSVCEYISRTFTKQKQEISCIYNFADPLKEICQTILGLTHDQCYGTDEQKNEPVDCYWENKQLSAREVMQILGTDMLRKLQHNVWANATIRKIKDEALPLALIADCRFPNEVDVVKQAGGLVIKLNRNLFNSAHASETAFDIDKYDHSNFDLVVDNQELSLEEKNNIIHKFLKDKGVLS